MNVIRNGPPRRARLAAVGAYAPDRVVTNAELERTVDTSEEWIVARTGIARSVLVVGSEVLSRITDPPTAPPASSSPTAPGARW